MGTKKFGYEFWNDVLHSPRYVAAPMVDMSELSYRLLCRRYGAQLCYSPMFHSQQFLQDSLYRSDIFSTSPDDTPLIVQFCANTPENFVNAASMVSSQCAAVDLNLGCPQAIARKGNYGAFLQDDWNLIHSIIRKASIELPIPVTSKMRILPGNFKKSIEYARMLENSGCSLLTVHGRTREQKGHATGLASWDVIKEIKASVKIPVIANGNIMSINDVEQCLEYTGADAVMSAEALLHNPALFSGENPPVWKIVEEYLNLAEKYCTHIRHVRCHLFKILYLCIHQDEGINRLLVEGSSFNDFYSICNILRDLPSRKLYNVKLVKHSEEEVDCFVKALNLDYSDSDCSSESYIEESELALIDSCVNQSDYHSAQSKSEIPVLTISYENEVDLMKHDKLKPMQRVFKNTGEVKENCEINSQNHKNIIVDENQVNENTLKEIIIEDHLPVWLCHSRPRIAIDDKNRGCYSKYFHASSVRADNSCEESGLSKKRLRKARRHARVLNSMKEKRKMKKLRRQKKLAEQRENQTNEVNVKEPSKVKMTKKQRKLLIRQRMLSARGNAPRVCIDLSFSSEMEIKELHRLSSQLRRLYGSNRNSEKPLHIYFCRFSPSDPLYEICKTKNDGFIDYVVEMTEKEPECIFPTESIIYLSPDSENVLEFLDEKKVYVIGGIVDGSVKKGLTLSHARNCQVQTAQLPINKHLVKSSQNPGTPVLTVNQVFDILLTFYETGDWVSSLCSNVPQRKGFYTEEDSSANINNCTFPSETTAIVPEYENDSSFL